MNERSKFVLEWARRWEQGQGRLDVAELCRVFGVSRPTGYRWINRYLQAGCDLRAMVDRSSRPRHSPRAVAEEMEDYLVEARKAHPRWGPRKPRGALLPWPETWRRHRSSRRARVHGSSPPRSLGSAAALRLFDKPPLFGGRSFDVSRR